MKAALTGMCLGTFSWFVETISLLILYNDSHQLNIVDVFYATKVLE